MQARADLFELWGIVESNSGYPVTSQLSVDVTDPGGDQVLFTFSNSGPLASSLTDIYFDDGALLGIASIDDSEPGVAFGFPATPGELPGAATVDPPFDTSTDTGHFSADSESSGVTANGVNPGESVGIVFDLEENKDFAAVISAIYLGFTHPDDYTGPGSWYDKSLRIGVHVQALQDGESETYILTPVPGAVILGMLGLGVAGWKLRKFA